MINTKGYEYYCGSTVDSGSVDKIKHVSKPHLHATAQFTALSLVAEIIYILFPKLKAMNFNI